HRATRSPAPHRGQGRGGAAPLSLRVRRSRGARRSPPAGDPSHRQGIDRVGAAAAREVTEADRRSTRDAANRRSVAERQTQLGAAVERTTNARPRRPSTSTVGGEKRTMNNKIRAAGFLGALTIAIAACGGG